MRITKQVQGTSAVAMDASCAACQFFVVLTDDQKQAETNRLGSAKEGACRRAPPDSAGHFAPVDPADWCGEFSAR